MKTHLPAHRSWFLALGLATVALGVVGWLPGSGGPGDDYGLDRASPQRLQPDPAPGATPPARRLRASSTMPYFSFAQSLRSRS